MALIDVVTSPQQWIGARRSGSRRTSARSCSRGSFTVRSAFAQSAEWSSRIPRAPVSGRTSRSADMDNR